MKEPIYIACDDEDSVLGHFFKSCSDVIRQTATDNSKDYKEICTPELNKETVNSYTIQAEDYIFACFSHGDETSLICQNDSYIEVDDNVKNFYSSVLYTFSCSSGSEIGKELSEAYVLGFFGYNAPVTVYPIQEDVFVHCATKGLVSFIDGKTLKESQKEMLKEYDEKINELAYVNFPAAAALLLNKESLVTIINNDDLTIND